MTAETGHPAAPSPSAETRSPRFGLSWKLLAIIVTVVTVSEVLIFVPSIANFRIGWLEDRLATAEAVAVVLSSSDMAIPREVQDDLLATVGADAIAIRDGEVSRLLATVEMPPWVEVTADIRSVNPVAALRDAMAALVSTDDRAMRIIGTTASGAEIEVIMSDGPLRGAMVGYSASIFIVTLVISIVTAGAVFFALNRLLVRPMRRMSQNMIAFSAAPEDASRVIRPSGRGDEIGVAEERLAAMQADLQALLGERRLADLGLAVSKISHDLRNMLASAHLFSDRLETSADPTVQQFAPKLIAALDRAIAYCQSTLTYGRAQEAPPERRLLKLRLLAEEVAELLGLDGQAALAWDNAVPAGLEVDADPDQLFRVLVNLCRNAVQAMENDRSAFVRRLTVEAEREGGVVAIRVRDTGPGVPAKAREHLFQPFQSARAGGTGLGLAIAAELLRAHGGTIRLADGEGPGAVFEIVIPDRPLEFSAARQRSLAG